jgi:hypothetical protein
MQTIHGTFLDRRGSEAIQVASSGTNLQTTIRGVSFSGTDFDSLSPTAPSEDFDLDSGFLCSCVLKVAIPVRMRAPGVVRHSTLHADIELGDPVPKRGLDRESVRLSVVEPEFSATSAGTSGWFEDEMIDLVRQFPSGFCLETCFTCGLSDYSPYGHGLFGCLACFRAAKDEYRRVSSKQAIFALWDRMTEYVQETHWCDQFEERPAGRGYRG